MRKFIEGFAEEFQEEYKSLSPFAQLLSDNQVSAYKVSQVTKVPQTTLSEWTRGNVDYLLVNVGNIYKISQYFDLTVEEFLQKMRVIN